MGENLFVRFTAGMAKLLLFLSLVRISFSKVWEYNEAKNNAEMVYTNNDDILIFFLGLDSADPNYKNYMKLLEKVDATFHVRDDVNFFYFLFEDERMQKLMAKNGIESDRGAQFLFVRYMRTRKGSFKAYFIDVPIELDGYIPGRIAELTKTIHEWLKQELHVEKKKKTKKTEL